MIYNWISLLLAVQVLSASKTSATDDVSPSRDSNEDDGQSKMVFISYAYEGSTGCKESTEFYMQRLGGLPPDLENYYNASVELGDHRKRINPVTLKIEFVTSAVITVDPALARVDHLEGNTYLMTIQGSLEDIPSSIDFVVRAPPEKPFPNVKLLELNGRPFCKLRPWYPEISGRVSQAASSPFIPPSRRIPRCGRKKIDHTALITKGEMTKEGDWPWHAALYLRDEILMSWNYICGATIITKKAVLTAAHCVVDNDIPIEASRLKLVIGKYNLDSSLDEHAEEKMIKQVIIHEGFKLRSMSNDIAMLKVTENIQFNNYVQPICLWNPNQLSKDVLYGEFGTVVGWGMNEKSELSEKLTVGAMRVVSDVICLASLPSFYSKFLNNNTFCAGNGPKNGTSACNGDSGGALIFPIRLADDLNTWYLRGVVSLSVRQPISDLCDPRHYMLMTDAARYLSWIEHHAEVVKPGVNEGWRKIQKLVRN